jgi:hypothetical protein
MCGSSAATGNLPKIVSFKSIRSQADISRFGEQSQQRALRNHGWPICRDCAFFVPRRRKLRLLYGIGGSSSLQDL